MAKVDSTPLKESNAPRPLLPANNILVRNGFFLYASFHHLLDAIFSQAGIYSGELKPDP